MKIWFIHLIFKRKKWRDLLIFNIITCLSCTVGTLSNMFSFSGFRIILEDCIFLFTLIHYRIWIRHHMNCTCRFSRIKWGVIPSFICILVLAAIENWIGIWYLTHMVVLFLSINVDISFKCSQEMILCQQIAYHI